MVLRQTSSPSIVHILTAVHEAGTPLAAVHHHLPPLREGAFGGEGSQNADLFLD